MYASKYVTQCMDLFTLLPQGSSAKVTPVDTTEIARFSPDQQFFQLESRQFFTVATKPPSSRSKAEQQFRIFLGVHVKSLGKSLSPIYLLSVACEHSDWCPFLFRFWGTHNPVRIFLGACCKFGFGSGRLAARRSAAQCGHLGKLGSAFPPVVQGPFQQF